jgi:hypothetical protein
MAQLFIFDETSSLRPLFTILELIAWFIGLVILVGALLTGTVL